MDGKDSFKRDWEKPTFGNLVSVEILKNMVSVIAANYTMVSLLSILQNNVQTS